MRITDEHLLEGARLQLLPGGSAMPVRRLLVIHFTSGATAQSSIDYWRERHAGTICAHLVIDRDGTVYQCRAFNKTAGHAGVSKWQDPSNGEIRTNCNAFSIGIELANAGDNPGLARRYTSLPLLESRHRNGGAIKQWERFPLVQLEACAAVSRLLVARYKLDDLVGHDDIAPDRKTDPGPAFPKEILRTACGFIGLPKVQWP